MRSLNAKPGKDCLASRHIWRTPQRPRYFTHRRHKVLLMRLLIKPCWEQRSYSKKCTAATTRPGPQGARQHPLLEPRLYAPDIKQLHRRTPLLYELPPSPRSPGHPRIRPVAQQGRSNSFICQAGRYKHHQLDHSQPHSSPSRSTPISRLVGPAL